METTRTYENYDIHPSKLNTPFGRAWTEGRYVAPRHDPTPGAPDWEETFEQHRRWAERIDWDGVCEACGHDWMHCHYGCTCLSCAAEVQSMEAGIS